MQYHEMMERCENYIVDHIEEHLSARLLADLCGYSLYHFCHVFKSYYQMPPAEYIRRLRLDFAARDIENGISVTETAHKYGFDTNAGFAKAFRKQYHMAAKIYRKQAVKMKGAGIMNYRIEKKEAFRAVGYQISGTKNEETAGAYWSTIDFKQFPAYPEGLDAQGDIGMWINPDEETGELFYFFGGVSDSIPAAEGFIEVNVPAAEYAVFDIDVPQDKYDVAVVAKNVKEGWEYIFKEWMDAQVTYAFDESKVCFELYLGTNVQIYIPVVAK